ncbi:MAG: hypothetical protein WC502_07455 [Methanolinea sp.]|jgi:hypothetical protein
MAEWAVPIGAGVAFFGGAVACGYAQSRIGSAGAGTVADVTGGVKVLIFGGIKMLS